ncbi:MAG: 50S ribosomal protein L35ae [Nanoarchaeota archaeon]|jgi:large subunit ribosomal protein L35Ae
MEGIVINYRRGRKTQTTNQMIVEVKDYDKEKAKSLVGKKVVYVCEGKQKKEIQGKVSAIHGNSGAVRVLFETGMPGQAIGQKVRLE